jgi:hypothetical protein
MRRIAAVALAGGMLTVLGGTAAQANGEYYAWNSEGSPQTASGYGSTAKGYGQWRLSGSPARSYLDARLYYTNGDNHMVYAVLETQGNCSDYNGVVCGTYLTDFTSETSRLNVPGTWAWRYASTAVDHESSKSRARATVCIDVPLRSDPCGSGAYAGPSNHN